MKSLILTLVIGLITVTASANEYRCKNLRNDKQLNFSIDFYNKYINFSNVQYLGHAQIETDYNFTSQVTGESIYFEYDWYYTAWYKLEFLSLINTHESGKNVIMKFSYDDSDGAWEERVTFYCEVKTL